MKNNHRQQTSEENLYTSVSILPAKFSPLFKTKLAIRARGITMGTVPNTLRGDNVFLPSRFHHGLEVANLIFSITQRALKEKTIGEDQADLLVVSGLMHDWGNPPFAHLSERLLKDITGMNGESYLSHLLKSEIGQDTRSVLESLGINPDQVVEVVTGNNKPLSDLVHGNLDADNLSNVSRYAAAMGQMTSQEILVMQNVFSQAFKFSSEYGWYFDSKVNNLLEQLMKWRENRRMVYANVFSQPHIVVAAMMFRALYERHKATPFTVTDFERDDNSMLDTLRKDVAGLMHQIDNWDWFIGLHHSQTTSPSNKLVAAVEEGLAARIRLADLFAEEFGLKPSDVSIFVAHTNSEREINILVDTDQGVMSVEKWLSQISGSDKHTHQPLTYVVQINVNSNTPMELLEKANNGCLGFIDKYLQ